LDILFLVLHNKEWLQSAACISLHYSSKSDRRVSLLI
jgi:hypothetical protein